MAEKLIVVTGGAGHVGSHVVEQLAQDPGNHIISVDNYFSGTPDNHIAAPNVEYRTGHTRDIAAVVPEKPDTIFHLGEYARIAPSFDDLDKVLEMNALGTMAVAQFWHKLGGSAKLVYAGSSTRFASNGDERNANPYSYTKAANVDLINNMAKWYKLPYAIAYFNNAYGPREKRDGPYATLIGKYEQAHLEGRPLTVTAPGTQRRNFTYVGDLAAGIIMAGEKGQGDGYVLGDPHSYSVLDIANAFGDPIEMVDGYPGRAKSGEAPTKAVDELNWQPTVGVLDYIATFVADHPRGSGQQ
jgi:UDP-glucose 4-epimerase